MNIADSPKHPLVTACLRAYGRPIRTRRMLECIFNQNFSGFELLYMSDGCPHYDSIIRSDWFKKGEQKLKLNGNRIYSFNAASPGNDWGAKVTNMAIKMAMGKHFVFLDNDDTILPEHLQYYYSSISIHERRGIDFVYNKMMIWNAGNKWVMEPKLEYGSVGHGSLIIRTEFLKTMAIAHQPVYGQDWLLIQDMIKAGGRSEKGNILFPTYYVMSNRNQPEPGMENDKGFDDEPGHMPVMDLPGPVSSVYGPVSR